MSTYYYKLKEPFSSVRFDDIMVNQDSIRLFTNGRLTGDILLPKGTGQGVLRWFFEEDVALHAWYGGTKEGIVVENHLWKWLPETQVISDEGELLTVQEVLELAGRGRDSAKGSGSGQFYPGDGMNP